MSLCILGKEKTETNIILLEEAKKRFGTVFFVPIDSIGLGLHRNFSITYRTSDLLKFEAVLSRVPRQSYSYAYQLLSLFPQETFMPVPPTALLLSTERFFLLTALRKRQVATINLHMVRSVKAGERALDSFQFPVVIRVPTQRTGVTVKTLTEAQSILEALGSLNHPALIEDSVRDVVSAYVSKPDVVASVRKVSRKEDPVFGEGVYKPHRLSYEARELALQTAEAIDTHVLRVDMTLKGGPRVVNIELNPNLASPSKVAGVNIPALTMKNVYANYRRIADKPMLVRFLKDARSVVKDFFREGDGRGRMPG